MTHRAAITAGLMAAMLMSSIDQTITHTAFPKIIADLGGVSAFTWVITAYLLTSTSVVLVVGKLADLFGRRIFFLGGLVLFVGGSALCGAAVSMGQLIAFRALQGLGAGMLIPIAITIIGDLYPGAERAKMQGLFGGILALSSVIGPKLGGWLTHNLSWRWIFYINLPIGVIGFALIWLFLKESRGERRPIDYAGAVTATAGFSLLMLALTQGGRQFAWGSWQSISMLAGSAALLGLFVLIERRAAEPVLDLRLFRNRTFAVMSALAVLLGIGMFGSVVFVPWFIQGVVGADPNRAGNVMAPMMFAIIFASIAGSKTVTRLTYRVQITAGLLLVGSGFFLMSRWSPETTMLQATLATVTAGLGLGLVMPLLTLGVQNAFDASSRGQVTGAITFFRSLGGMLGTTLFGLLFQQQMSARYAETAGPVIDGLVARVPAAAGLLKGMAARPDSLVQLLLQGELTAALDPALRDPLLAAIKLQMSASLHTVFLVGLAVVAVGALVAQGLGRIRLQVQEPVAAQSMAD